MYSILHRIIPVTAAVVLTLSTTVLHAVSIQTVDPRYITTGEFQRISEFFSGEENSSGRLIVRTMPDERDGMYLVVRLDSSVSQLPAGSQVRLDVVSTAKKDVSSYTLPLVQTGASGKTLLIGVTGSDWPDKAIKPLAWHITIVDASGQKLVEFKSYLWEMP